MLSKEDNEFACRVGPGTPMGELFRRFWLPAMLPGELPKPDYPPVRLRLLNEDLVAFRDSNGEIGVIDAHCPHRGASLYFGSNGLPSLGQLFVLTYWVPSIYLLLTETRTL